MKEHGHSIFDVRVKKSVTGKIRKFGVLCIRLGDVCGKKCWLGENEHKYKPRRDSSIEE